MIDKLEPLRCPMCIRGDTLDGCMFNITQLKAELTVWQHFAEMFLSGCNDDEANTKMERIILRYELFIKIFEQRAESILIFQELDYLKKTQGRAQQDD